MIYSRYILDIFELAMDDVDFADLLKQQIDFLNEDSREHTEVGLYINFSTLIGIEKFRIPTDNAHSIDIEGKPTELLIGVEIKNESLNILADTTIHVTNGIISRLEIWNKNGKNYPHDEPTHYELTQIWRSRDKRRTIIR